METKLQYYIAVMALILASVCAYLEHGKAEYRRAQLDVYRSFAQDDPTPYKGMKLERW